MEELKNIKDLGIVQGKLLFFGGVYSNLQALQGLKGWAEENGFTPGNIFCTGDILGYCAQPVECIQLIKEWGIHSIAGNVEIQVRNSEDDCGCDFKSGGRCDLFSRNWYAYIRSKVDAEAIDWLHTLPHHIQFTYGNKKLLMVHGSWFGTSEFIFKSTPWENKHKNFEKTGADVIIAGHCGLPFADERNNKYWLNAGVIGMPANDGTDRVWFSTVEQNEEQEVFHRFHSLQYDNKTASELMISNGLPTSYAATLLTGIWDNCEILPAEEQASQGVAISLHIAG